MDRGNVGRRSHRPELLGILLPGYILRLVHLEEYVGRIPYHVGRLIGGEENLPGIAQPHDIVHLRPPYAPVAPGVEPLFEPRHGDDRLRFEGRGALYRVAPAGDEQGEQQHFELC